AVGGEAHGDDAAAKALAERKAGALILAVHLLEEDAHDGAVRLVADEQLFFERPESSAGAVEIDAGRGLAHFPVREHHAGGIKLRNLLRCDHLPALALGNHRRLAEIFRVGLLIPLETLRMADEAADGEAFESAGAVPGALVVSVEDVAVGVEADAPGGANAA